jgi:hypothetical protein
MKQMSLSARQELIACIRPRYQAAGRKDKQRILDEFVAATGYHRKYATGALNRSAVMVPGSRRRHRDLKYGDDVRDALVTVWKAANQPCSKRLVPFLPEFVSVLERCGHLTLSELTRNRLLELSPATADRLLRDARRVKGSGLSRTRPGTLLKHQVPVRTFADWNDVQPGFVEADLVAHCGSSTHGAYLNTLTLTDVSTGWTECLAVLFDDHKLVLQAIEKARAVLPFPLLGLDTDNGSEFLNHGVLDYCRRERITFTRCRPYKKNDQCHVEQKNGSVVRRLVGYDSYEGPSACTQLAALYGTARLYLNFFQPTMKLLSKQRRGGKVVKTYEAARTPYQRVLESEQISAEAKEVLRRQYAQLDPVALLARLEMLQDSLWQYAHRSADWVRPEPEARAAVALGPASAVTSPKPETELVDSPISTGKRTYRRTKKPSRYHLVDHTWRTRADPFALVHDRIEQMLTEEPGAEVKAILRALQREYPGHYEDKLLRTLQRRVNAWRGQRVAACPALLDPTGVADEALAP